MSDVVPNAPVAPANPAPQQSSNPTVDADDVDALPPTRNFAEFQRRANERSDKAAKQREAQTPRDRIQELTRKATVADQGDAPDQSDPPDLSGDTDADADSDADNQQKAVADPSQHAAKYQEWLDSPVIPQEFMSKLVKTEDGEYEPLEEALKGRMRHRDYTRKNTEVARMREQLEAASQTGSQMTEDLRDPPKFVEIMEARGYDLEPIADLILTRYQQDTELAQGRGIAVMQRLGLPISQESFQNPQVQEAMQKEMARIKEQRRQETMNRATATKQQSQERTQQQQESAQQQAAKIDRWKRQISQLQPSAFKVAGLDESKRNFKIFYQATADIMEERGAKDVTPDIIRDAVKWTQEEIKDLRRDYQGSKKPTTTPQGMGGGAGKQLVDHGRRKTSSDTIRDTIRKTYRMGG